MKLDIVARPRATIYIDHDRVGRAARSPLHVHLQPGLHQLQAQWGDGSASADIPLPPGHLSLEFDLHAVQAARTQRER